jgi:dipeptidyl aminopeptidase/acylaminoacyl peptidase
VTTLRPGQSSHRFPQWLSDGRRFLYLALGDQAVKGVFVGSLDGGEPKRLLDGEPPFAFLPPNHLLFARQGALWAQRMNVASAALQGDLLPLAPVVHVHSNVNGQAAFSPTAVGSIAYRAATESRAAVWLDRTGRETGVLVPPDTSQLEVLRFSPDGRSVALRRTVDGNTDVWLADTSRGALRRLTFGLARKTRAPWTGLPTGSSSSMPFRARGPAWISGRCLWPVETNR